MAAALLAVWQFVWLQPVCALIENAGIHKYVETREIGDDIPIYSWIEPKAQPWAVLLCIHGLSLHGTNYDAFAHRMAAQGVPTYAIDVRGFGSWQNLNDAHRVDLKEALNDIHRALESLRDAHPDLPIVLLGESMGGALALQAAAQNEELIDGLICCVPASKRKGQKMTSAKVAVGLLTAPHKQLHAGPAVVKRATQNPELVEAWQEKDEMARMKLSAKELLDFAVFCSHNASAAQHVADVPVLFVQGAKDQLIKPEGTLVLYQKLSTRQKSLYMVNSEHLIFEHNQFSDEVVEHVTAWMRANAVPTFAKREHEQDSHTLPENIAKAEGHLKVAQGFMLLSDPRTAQDHLLQAIAIAKGSHVAQQAEHLLCSLPENVMAPDPKDIAAEDVQFITHQQAVDSSKPWVLMFYADWIVGSHEVQEAINDALAKYGNKVNFVRLDADAPENREIIAKYAIRPLPTLLYLDHKNKVVGHTFGFPGPSAIEAKIRALIATTPR